MPFLGCYDYDQSYVYSVSRSKAAIKEGALEDFSLPAIRRRPYLERFQHG